MLIFYIILLLIIAAISKSIMDTVLFKFSESIFSNEKTNWWFDANKSWKNKYKNKNPKDGEAFFGSTTIFVWITDAWHFFQEIIYSSFFIIIILCLNQIYFQNLKFWETFFINISILIVIKIFFGLFFELFWAKIFKKKYPQ